MESHPFSANCSCPACWGTTALALSELRDALTRLSLALKDLQFECDAVQRRHSEGAVLQLLNCIAQGHRSGRAPGQGRV